MLLSRASSASKWVKREVKYADWHGKEVVAVRIDDTDIKDEIENDLKIYLFDKQIIDLWAPNCWDVLPNSLQKMIGTRVGDPGHRSAN